MPIQIDVMQGRLGLLTMQRRSLWVLLCRRIL